MLRQNVIRFYKGLYITFKLAPDLKKITVYLSSYSPLNKGLPYRPPVWWSRIIYTILKDGVIGNIRVKLFEIWTSCLGGDIV